MLVASPVTALRGTKLFLDVSIGEIANYTSERFICEPDLWRVQVRTIHGLLDAIESIVFQVDRTARVLRKAEYSLLPGSFQREPPSLSSGRSESSGGRYFRSLERRRSLRTRPPVCSFGQ